MDLRHARWALRRCSEDATPEKSEWVDVMVVLDFVSLEKVNTVLGRNDAAIPWLETHSAVKDAYFGIYAY